MTSVALAQTLIPTGISSSCASFLNDLNNDKSVGACTSALTQATSAFAPGSDATKTPSTASVTTTLTNLCAATIDTACSESLIGAKITAFYSACSADLTSNVNTDVLRDYDVLYTILPFRNALCSKDDAGNYCAVQSKLPSSLDIDTVQKTLTTQDLPNPATYKDTGLLFLFAQATAASSDLCTSCTRKIMNAYTTYEGKMPYGPGVGKSPFLANQPTLYTAITNTCGTSFLSEAGVVKAAGGLSGGTFSDSKNAATSAGFSMVFASIGAALLAFSSL